MDIVIKKNYNKAPYFSISIFGYFSHQISYFMLDYIVS
ncbi:hypothetical protein SSUST3_1404 [Streptococcus suis ST3]|nr:hypothetical protein SSUST3_1404 [Streptococcus suis ST3]AER17739.1 hypothetical protein SSUD9_1555 [Streptococcus suis D9]AGW87755.1 hypothetical protein YB51_6915 [Streptococcus suis YB51]